MLQYSGFKAAGKEAAAARRGLLEFTSLQAFEVQESWVLHARISLCEHERTLCFFSLCHKMVSRPSSVLASCSKMCWPAVGAASCCLFKECRGVLAEHFSDIFTACYVVITPSKAVTRRHFQLHALSQPAEPGSQMIDTVQSWHTGCLVCAATSRQ